MGLIENPETSKKLLNQEVLLHRITNRIRQSLELEEILSVTVDEVRSLLATDRVMVYRFHADAHGEVIAESVNLQRLPSLLGLHFPADDIPLQARELFLTARQRSIVEVASQQIGVSPLTCPETGELLEAEDIRYRPVDPCHVQYLTAMGVQSSLVVPILHEQQLWGLLVSHHAEPRSVIEWDLEVLQQVADQVCVAIAQATLLVQVRAKAQREATINQIATLLHSMPTLQLQEALEETIVALQASGGRLYCMAESPHRAEMLYTYGIQPQTQGLETKRAIEQSLPWQALFQPQITRNRYGETGLQAISDLYQPPHLRVLVPAFRDTPIRSLLVIPLWYRQQFLGYLTLFRDAIAVETLWAGQFHSDQRQSQPRRSFAAWKEAKQGQAQTWTAEELELAQALGNHFAIAVQQYATYQQLHQLNAGLEFQIQERTAELKQSLERASVLRQVTAQIRNTLNLKTILQTIVREVRSLLKTDRVVIYQFLAPALGEVIVEDVAAEWLSILGKTYQDACFPEQFTAYYLAGRVRAINHVALADIAECHKALLETMQVQANLVVPIRMGTILWGLLIVHECHAPRVWLPPETELLQQLADQAAIAIQQAELYEHSCTTAATAQAQAHQLEQTAAQLTQALRELQTTQAQLVQNEKMSSLGQLVAGVAHEINNPVNFIYGNLNHAAAYAQDLLDLIAVYQAEYPQPNLQVRRAIERVDLEFLAEDFPKILSSMRIGADRIRMIVQSLRNFSRLDQAEKKPVDIHEGIDSTLLILHHRLKPNRNVTGIQVVREYGNLPLVECYAGQLNQVFMNILSNAIDALDSRDRGRSAAEILANPSQITIQTALDRSSSPARLIVRIRDNGPGISAAVQTRLFDPFFTTKPIGQGTGLGLSISYQVVVDRHNGQLTCHSQPGQGAEFCIQIPIHSPSSQQVQRVNIYTQADCTGTQCS